MKHALISLTRELHSTAVSLSLAAHPKQERVAVGSQTNPSENADCAHSVCHQLCQHSSSLLGWDQNSSMIN